MSLLDALRPTKKRKPLDPSAERLVALSERRQGHDMPLDPCPLIHLREADGSWSTYEQEDA